MDSDLKKTCLHDFHVELGAKMSPFAGYDMPIQYSGIAAEHEAVRKAVGVFDVSHMGEIFVSGPDAEVFINRIFTNDVRLLADGAVQYGMMLYPDGGTVDDLLVYREAEGRYLLVVNAANIDKDDAWIREHSAGYDVIVDNESEAFGQIAVQGPLSEKTVVGVLGLSEAPSLGFYTFVSLGGGGNGRIILSRTGYTGEDGFEIYASHEDIRAMWQKLVAAGVTPCGLGCRDTLRFEAGLPLYGDELSETISPVMAGLGIFCKLDKENFIGRDALVAQKRDGTKTRLVGIEVLDRAIPRAGYDVELQDGGVIGKVTTGYRSPSLDRSLCFALVDSAYAALGTELCVRIHRQALKAVVVKKRFYQTNYKK